jgi:choice-of-anchor B domain-containing protein
MKLKLWLTSFAILPLLATAQLNVELVSNLDYNPILNDIWGYVDKSGTEYALVGMTTGLSIVSLEDPADPREVQFINGVNSTWRDIKTWEDFAYVTADQGQDGLLIIDLSTLPDDTAAYAFYKPDIVGVGTLQKSHNIWIDEFGLAYLAGANIGGTAIFDLKSDPWNPEFLTNMPYDYAHDVYVRDSLVYASEIYKGQLGVYRISDLANIKLLGFTTTPFAFTHNAWTSDDGKTCFTTDERANAFVASYDVSDPSDIKELDRFRPAATNGKNVIPHNVHVFNDYAIVSYYTDGCIIVDGSRPDNLIEVGNYDSYIGANGGFNGAWGAYPFLPSGLVLVSDRQSGLYVLAPQYKRGCYFEGSVRNKLTQNPVANAMVEILLDTDDDSEVLLPEATSPDGNFKMGKAVAGTYTVRVSHPDYYTFEGDYTFENGVLVEVIIDLEPKPEYSVTGQVIHFSTAETIGFAHVAVQDEFHLYQTEADANGMFMIPSVFEGSYKIYAGDWGRFQISDADINGNFAQNLYVNNGYYDDFLYVYGWSVTSTSTGASWVRGVPKSELLFNNYQCNPAVDVDDDFGGLAYVTGNNGGNAANDAVRDGMTLLSSPIMDLTTYTAPLLSYRPWLCQVFAEENAFFTLISNGSDTVTLDTITAIEIGGEWRPAETFEVDQWISITDQMQVHFMVSEGTEMDNIVKAGLDLFTVYEGLPSGTKDGPNSIGDLKLYPSPAADVLYIDLTDIPDAVDAVSVVDLFGRQVAHQNILGLVVNICGGHLAPGIYVVQASGKGSVVAVGKVVVQ